ncbi:MAG: hypothetical protein H7Y60_10835 [Rhodospirillaceae bacterium]|nr:hypothetical protein [Rhodospirillales bacterium]
MARTIVPTMAHQPPHHPAPKPAPKHQAPGHHHPHPAPKSGHGGLIAVLVIAAALLAAVVWYVMPARVARLDPVDQLLDQMQAAADGTVAPVHVFGGALTVTRANGRSTVTAEALPSKPCVQVGWRLSKEGTIIVNGVLSQRLSAAKLSEMCSGEGGASLTWRPEE